MHRIFVLLAFTAWTAFPASTAWDRKVENAARTVRSYATRAPDGVALDSLLRTAELLRPTHPQLAREFALAAVEKLKARKDSGPENARAVQILMAIDPVEGERTAWSFGDTGWVYGALARYWVGKEEYGRAADLVRKSWRGGMYIFDAGFVISKLKDKRPEEATALYRDVVDALDPAKATPELVRMLISSGGNFAESDPKIAAGAIERLLPAMTAERFDAEKMQRLAVFKIGDKELEAGDSRESLLIAAGIYLHGLAPEAYGRHKELFAKWADAIAAVKPEDTLSAVRPVRTRYSTREELAKLKAAPPAEIAKKEEPKKEEPKKKEPTPFAEAFAKVQSGPEDARVSGLSDLLDRDDLTTAEYIRTAQAMLPLLAKTSFEKGRLAFAEGLFDYASSRDWKPVVRPSAKALYTAIQEFEKCTEPACVSRRQSGEPARAYETLASGLSAANLRMYGSDPALAARRAIRDLKDVLDEKFDFQLAMFDGTKYSLSAQRGKVVMLQFWASW